MPYSDHHLMWKLTQQIHAILQCCRLIGVDLNDQAATIAYIRVVAEATKETAYDYSVLHRESADLLAAMSPSLFAQSTEPLRKETP